jgi:hypothetical protein
MFVHVIMCVDVSIKCAWMGEWMGAWMGEWMWMDVDGCGWMWMGGQEEIFENFVSLLAHYRSPTTEEILDEAFHAADLEALLTEFEGYQASDASESDLLGGKWKEKERMGEEGGSRVEKEPMDVQTDGSEK